MMNELAIAAASAIVGAMSTGAWETAKTLVLGLFRHGGEDEEEISDHLESTRGELQRTGHEPAAITHAQDAWAGRFSKLIREHPELSDELDRLGYQIRGQSSAGPLLQHNVSQDHSKQANLGSGTQVNKF